MSVEPTTHPRLVIRQDRAFVRSMHHSHRFVVATVTAPHATRERRRPPVNLAIVLDRSGSMSGSKLDVAKSAVEEAISRLEPTDRFSVVVYDDTVDVVVESTPASPEARRSAVDQLGRIGPRGSTNLAEGWLRGCEQVAAHLSGDSVDRCLLLTDGLANVGIIDATELASHAAALRARGISTSTFGVGTDFDEALLQGIADAGGGHFYYIADAPQIRDAITGEVGETLEVVARGVTLDVTARDAITVEPISPFRATTTAGRTRVDLGDLGSDQVVEVVLRLGFPLGDLGSEVGAVVSLSDREGVFAPGGTAEAVPARVAWTFADTHTNDRQPRDADVDRIVARLFAARARQEAVLLNKGGDFIHATWALSSTADRIKAYAGSDPVMRGLIAELEQEQVTFAAPMAARALKQAHYASANLARSRDSSGRSLKHS